MKYVTFLILFSVSLIVKSQNLWFQEGTTWVHTVNVQDYFGWIETKLVGDDVINGQSCKKFEVKYKYFDTSVPEPVLIDSNDNYRFIYMYASADDNQVYFYENQEFVLIYDFTKSVGESISLPYPNVSSINDICPNRDFEITETGTETINGVDLKYLKVQPTSSSNYFYEGKIYQKIGSTSLYFSPFVSSSYCTNSINDMNFETFFRCFDDNTSFSYKDDVVINDFNGNCYYPSESSLSVGKFEKSNQLLIYPNPTKNKITIPFNDRYQEINIYSIEGKLLKKMNINGNRENYEIDLSEFSEGIYYIKETQSGYISRIIKMN